MEACEVLVVGGGPAGSSCAWALRQAGVDVIVADRAGFPRDKVCAGWITPQVLADLGFDCDEYRAGRTFQPITGFRTGLIGEAGDMEISYDRPVSYGIRRCEFDHYLLARSAARLKTGTPIEDIRRDRDGWIINGTLRAAMLVGAGGYFCPVARRLNPRARGAAPVVIAQEAEFPIERETEWRVEPGRPELYFCRDLKGYGWCFRKGDYLNVGIGRIDDEPLPAKTEAFVAFLRARGRMPPSQPLRWRGHAYLVSEPPTRRLVDQALLLAGDAAGLAYPQSGEGIRPAVESGLLAASAIIDSHGDYAHRAPALYEERVRSRFQENRRLDWLAGLLPVDLGRALAPLAFRNRSVVRHVVLDRWFLRAHDRPLSGAGKGADGSA
jgi:flavin-dependent dehydrogenase